MTGLRRSLSWMTAFVLALSAFALPAAAEGVQVPFGDISVYDLELSKRDLSSTYDAASAVRIEMNGSAASVTGSGAAFENGLVTIQQAGTYVVSGTGEEIMILISAGENDKVQLVLENAALVNHTGPAIAVAEADKVFITLPEGTASTLEDGKDHTVTCGGSNADGVVFSKTDLTINGGGALTVTGNNKHGIVGKDDLVIVDTLLHVTAPSTAIDGQDSVKVSGASVDVNAGSNGIRANREDKEGKGFVYLLNARVNAVSEGDGIEAATALISENSSVTVLAGQGAQNRARNDETSRKGLKAGGDLYLLGGLYTVNSADDGIHANGAVEIRDGSFEIASGDDGVHGDEGLWIRGGHVTVSQSLEGLEGRVILIEDGVVDVTASDDGINAGGGNSTQQTGRFGRGMFDTDASASLYITGGTVRVNANGDGVDSNGDLIMSGGVLLVSGPVNSGNGALDYGLSGTVSGGTVAAAGSSGMAENFSEAQNQGSMLVQTGNQAAGTPVALVDDETGEAVVAFIPQKAYSTVVFSAPGIQDRKSYTVICGGTAENADETGFAQDGKVTGGEAVATVTMDGGLYGGTMGRFGGNFGGFDENRGGRKGEGMNRVDRKNGPAQPTPEPDTENETTDENGMPGMPFGENGMPFGENGMPGMPFGENGMPEMPSGENEVPESPGS